MNQYHSAPAHQEEGEKPFWISYSDLMTALMILFLVVMVSTLSAVTKQTIPVVDGGLVPQLKEPERKADIPRPDEPQSSSEEKFEKQRQAETMQLCKDLEAKSDLAGFGASINCESKTIDLGEGARFQSGKWELSAAGRAALANIVPLIIETAQTDLGQKWLKRVHIQGFTDTDGSYLYNLNLSLKRSEWVMCQLLSDEGGEASIQLLDTEKRVAKKLFFIGGVSFNNARESKDASRRVEFKLEFNNQQAGPAETAVVQGKERAEKCQI